MTAKNDSGSVAEAEDTGWKQLTKIARWQQSTCATSHKSILGECTLKTKNKQWNTDQSIRSTAHSPKDIIAL